MSASFRIARVDDAPRIAELLAASIRTLGAHDYTAAQIERALSVGAFGVDTTMIRDETYFVAEHGDAVLPCVRMSKPL